MHGSLANYDNTLACSAAESKFLMLFWKFLVFFFLEDSGENDTVSS